MISFIIGLKFANQSARSLAISASFSSIGASAPWIESPNSVPAIFRLFIATLALSIGSCVELNVSLTTLE